MNFIIIIFCSIVLPMFSLRQIKPKFCINCKYFIADNYNNEHGRCSLFEIKTFPSYNDTFLVNGISKDEDKNYLFCSVARVWNHKCGPEGKMYEKKYTKKNKSLQEKGDL